MPQADFNPAEKFDWKDLPLHSVLYEWLLNNMKLPADLGTLVAYVGLFFITWYAIIWMVRLIMSIIWPLFIIGTAVVVFRLLQYYEPDEIATILTNSVSVLADTLVTVVVKTLEIVLCAFD